MSSRDRQRWRSRAWRATGGLIVVWLGLRVAYLAWLCPYELLGDEANVWEWSRRLHLAYDCAGPGVALLVGAATRLFGHHEWAVRLPAVLAGAVAALLLVRLAVTHWDGNERVGPFAAACFFLTPGYHLWSQIMTYDMPYTACWVGACWVAWRLVEGQRSRRPVGLWWLALGLVLGVGFLFKFSIVLLVPGLVIYAVWARRSLRWRGAALVWAAVGACVFVVVITPVIVWNVQHDWYHVLYLARHLNAPLTAVHTGPWNPLWAPEYLGAQLLIFGPPLTVLLVVGLREAWRQRRENPALWDRTLFCVCCGVPMIGFFLLVTPWTRAQANWPLPAYVTLLMIVAQTLAGDRRGPLRCGWGAAVAWGVLSALLISFPQAAARVPVVGHSVPLYRFSGSRELAARVDLLVRNLRAETGKEPLIIASHYSQASLLAFYLPQHPVTYSASSRMGWRPDSYDFWPETDLASGLLRGRPAVLVGGTPQQWRGSFVFGQVRWASHSPAVSVGYDYQGPR